MSAVFPESQTLNTAQSKDANLMDRDLMQVVFSLAKAGHQQYVPEIVECMRHERGYVPGTVVLACNVEHLSDFFVIFKKCIIQSLQDFANASL